MLKIKLGGIKLKARFSKIGVVVLVFMFAVVAFKLSTPNAKDTNKSVDVATKTLKEDHKDLSFDASYPEVNLQDEHVKNKINNTLKQSVYDFKNYIENSYKEASSLYANEGSSNPIAYEGKTTFTYTLVGNVLSVRMEYFQYTGGAHPTTYVGTYNFDLKDGKNLKLDEIFNDNGKKEYKDLIDNQIRSVISQNPEKYFADEFKGVGENTQYYLTKDGVKIAFQLYEIAPYSSGLPEFEVPYSTIKDKLAIGV